MRRSPGILGAGVSEQRLHMAIVSVVAQLQFYNFTRLIRDTWEAAEFRFPDPELIAEHIYQFSLAGLKGMLEESSL